MGKGFRYTMEHIGDIFVEKLAKGFSCLKSSTQGILSAYDLHELKKKKRKIQTEIGERMVEVKENHPQSDVFRDEELVRLFASLDELEERIEDCRKKRDARLDPKEA